MSNKIAGIFKNEYYESSSLGRVIDLSIKELYNTKDNTSIQLQVQNLFDEYNKISNIIPLSGGDLSHNALINLINQNTGGDGVVYKDAHISITFNDITTLVDQSASMADQLEALLLKAESELQNENNIEVPNGSFENWKNGMAIDWSGLSLDHISIYAASGTGSKHACRLIRKDDLRDNGIYTTNDIDVNLGERLKIEGDVRTSDSGSVRVWVGDTRVNNPDNPYAYSWSKAYNSDASPSWSHWEMDFVPGKNIYTEYPGSMMKIFIYASRDENSANQWAEFDNIKITRYPESKLIPNDTYYLPGAEPDETPSYPCPYQRDHGMLIFNTNAALQQHIADEHTWNCPWCTQVFVYESDLQQHIADEHTWICPYSWCAQLFHSELELQHHIDSIHNAGQV